MIDEEHDRRITSFTNSKKKREGERKKEITIIGSGKFTYTALFPPLWSISKTNFEDRDGKPSVEKIHRRYYQTHMDRNYEEKTSRTL